MIVGTVHFLDFTCKWIAWPPFRMTSALPKTKPLQGTVMVARPLTPSVTCRRLETVDHSQVKDRGGEVKDSFDWPSSGRSESLVL